ncbi:MAG: ABC transporter substrate-binding protein [Pseudomonadales bacterium]
MNSACDSSRWRQSALLLLLWVLPLPGQAGESLSEPVLQAQTRVEAFHAQLIDSVAGPVAVAERYQRLRPVVARVFNSPTIARLSLGRTWRDLSAPAQAAFTEALTDLIAATYADRFSAAVQPTFTLLDAVAGRRGPVIKTQLQRSNGQRVALDYHFRSGRIYNVVADGVSDLSLRRADYNTVVKSAGFAALLQNIRSQQQDLLGVEPVPVAGSDQPVLQQTTQPATGPSRPHD